MKAVVQRVASASVQVDSEMVGRIGKGLLVLVGVTHGDDVSQARALAKKVHELRIFPEAASAMDIDAPMLVVSQFTLYADSRKGRRPSWSAAAPALVAEPLIETFITTLKDRGAHVEVGRFGAHMQVALVNDGPVTLIVEVPPDPAGHNTAV